jgi:hypothetical protein
MGSGLANSLPPLFNVVKVALGIFKKLGPSFDASGALNDLANSLDEDGKALVESAMRE